MIFAGYKGNKTMKLRDFELISNQYLIPYLPGFTAKGKLLFQIPIEMLLCGFCFEQSAWDKNQFRIEVIVQPLYLPYEHLVFLISSDLGNLSDKRQQQMWWNIKDGKDDVLNDVRKRIMAAGVRWLNNYSSPCDIASKVKVESSDDLHMLRAIAYSWIMCGKQYESIKSIEQLHKAINRRGSGVDWICEMADEVTRMKTLLHVDIETAKEELMKYRENTITQLGLNKWSVY